MIVDVVVVVIVVVVVVADVAAVVVVQLFQAVRLDNLGEMVGRMESLI